MYSDGKDTIVVVQPFFHMAGKIVALSCGLFSGATLVVYEQFEYKHYLKLNEKYRVRYIEQIFIKETPTVPSLLVTWHK